MTELCPLGQSSGYGACADEHARSARGIFREAHVPAKNVPVFIRVCGRELCEANFTRKEYRRGRLPAAAFYVWAGIFQEK